MVEKVTDVKDAMKKLTSNLQKHATKADVYSEGIKVKKYKGV